MGLFPPGHHQGTREEHGDGDEPEATRDRPRQMGHQPKAQSADTVAQITPEAINSDGGAAPI
ncbi:MAG: hypothetical protein XD36_2666 [Halomonas sp. 54_146]|nr:MULTISPECIES: hypothetical protein [unclassified Halomonas]KUJ86938.1 MAG: hypothetical protein XD36_2666 [Halomonas sp. 54_146]